MNVFKWSNPRYYLCFSPDGDGAAASSPASPSSGDGGGAASAPAPSAGDSGGASGGASTTPTPAESSASPAIPSTPEAAPDPWANLGSVDDLDHLAELPPIPAPPQATPQSAPVAPTPQPTPAPQATPAVQNPEQTPPTTQQPVAPSLSPSNPVAIAEAMAANRDGVIAHLAQERFALSDVDIQELETNAAAFVPKMMARVAYEAQVSMMKFLAQSVPGMVKQYNTVQTANNKAETQFFDTHKTLGLDKDNQKHREVAFRMASLYRQANPQMPLEQLIAEVGPIVAAAVQAQAPAAQPAATPPPPAGFRPVPFTPAVNGGGGFTPQAAPADPWSGMGANYDE